MITHHNLYVATFLELQSCLVTVGIRDKSVVPQHDGHAIASARLIHSLACKTLTFTTRYDHRLVGSWNRQRRCSFVSLRCIVNVEFPEFNRSRATCCVKVFPDTYSFLVALLSYDSMEVSDRTAVFVDDRDVWPRDAFRLAGHGSSRRVMAS